MKTYSIDRFEGKYAVCIDQKGTALNIEKSMLPTGAREGDIVVEKGGKLAVDSEKTKAARQEITDLQDKLFK